MLTCDGYKMFHGTVKVSPAILPDGTRWREPFDLTGTWLLKPESPRIWFCEPDGNGWARSFEADILSDFRDDCAG